MNEETALRVERFVNEQVATCRVCGEPVRRNQPRKLIDRVSTSGGTGEWWKDEWKGGNLVHLSCAPD